MDFERVKRESVSLSCWLGRFVSYEWVGVLLMWLFHSLQRSRCLVISRSQWATDSVSIGLRDKSTPKQSLISLIANQIIIGHTHNYKTQALQTMKKQKSRHHHDHPHHHQQFRDNKPPQNILSTHNLSSSLIWYPFTHRASSSLTAHPLHLLNVLFIHQASLQPRSISSIHCVSSTPIRYLLYLFGIILAIWNPFHQLGSFLIQWAIFYSQNTVQLIRYSFNHGAFHSSTNPQGFLSASSSSTAYPLYPQKILSPTKHFFTHWASRPSFHPPDNPSTHRACFHPQGIFHHRNISPPTGHLLIQRAPFHPQGIFHLQGIFSSSEYLFIGYIDECRIFEYRSNHWM